MIKILAFAGSTREQSFNKKIARAAAKGAEAAGAQVTFIDLRDYPLPLFDEDVEAAGFPDNASKLKELFKAHDALLIASPEYNSSIAPVLKNAIDWVSRPTGDSAPLEAFDGKVAGLLAASPGALGGLRGLFHVRDILQNIRVMVVPSMVTVSSVHEKLADDGSVSDDKTRQAIEAVGAAVAKTTAGIKAG